MLETLQASFLRFNLLSKFSINLGLVFCSLPRRCGGKLADEESKVILFTKLDFDCGAVDQPTTLGTHSPEIFEKFIQPKRQNTGLPTLTTG
jgi:hypothetical protein